MRNAGLIPFVFALVLAMPAAAQVEFTFDTDNEGWNPTGSGLTNVRNENGAIAWDYDDGGSFDPYFIKSGVSIDANANAYVIVESYLKAVPGAGAQFIQIFFDNGQGFAGGDPFREFAISFYETPNVGFVKRVLHASDLSADWGGTITATRIDPGNNGADLDGYSGYLDRIAYVPESQLAHDPYVWDFRGGDQGWNVTSASNSVAYDNGKIVITYDDPAPENFDPVIQNGLPVLFDAAGLHYMRFDIEMTHSTADPVPLQIYFFKLDGSVGLLETTIEPNVGRKSYFYNMFDSTEVTGPDGAWSGLGAITTLRFDIGAGDYAPYAASQATVHHISLFDGQADSDGDRLKDHEEIDVYGTNAANPDTDGDGMSDGLEVLYHTDPNDALDFIDLPAHAWTGLLLLAAGLTVLFCLVLRRMKPARVR